MGFSVRGSLRHRATGAALAALLLGGGAVGCGSDGASDSEGGSAAVSPAAAVAKAAENAEEITSLHFRMNGRSPEEGRFKAEARMRMEPTVAMDMKMTALDQEAGGTAEIRLVDEAMYIGGGAAAAQQMDGKSWIKFDLSDLGKEGEALGSEALASQANKNPAQDATLLTGSDDVTKVGTETVDGVKTTHYKGTVTLDRFRESLKDEDKETREQREKAVEQYEAMGVETLTMHIWIDGKDQTKQFRMQGEGTKGPLDMTITFLGVNESVTVEAPPAKETTDLAEMMKGFEQS